MKTSSNIQKKRKKKRKLKETLRNIEKKTILLAVSLVVLFIIILAVSFFLGVRIKFILNEEIRIELNPTYKSFSVNYAESPAINFTIKNHNFKLCNAFCEYRLRDLRTNKIIDYENKTIASGQIITKGYNLPPNEVGSGQNIFLFEVECNNIKTNLCYTEQKKNYKSASVFVNYDISDEEKIIKEKLLNELPVYLNKLKESEIRMKSNKARISFFQADNLTIIPDEISFLKNISNKLEQEFINLRSSYSNLKNMWEKKNYYNLESDFTAQLRTGLMDYEKEVENQSDTIKNTINLYNNIINLSVSLASNQNKLNEIYVYYLNKSTNKTNFLVSYYTQLNETLSMKENRQVKRYIGVYASLSAMEKEFHEFNADYELQKEKDMEEFINYTKDFLNISVIDESVDYCLILNHSFCSAQTLNDTFSFSFSMPFIEDELKADIIAETNSTLSEHYPECCAFNKCMECCSNCTGLYPVIFIHGHLLNKENSPEISLNSFSKIQRKLMDEGYINLGQIDFGSTLEEIGKGELGKMSFPLTVRVSYYYISYYDFGSYRITTEKSDRIENYAIRLKEAVDLIKEKTGRNKVDVVAHSMGGLVARDYLTIFGEEDINKLIIIGTPNHGIQGRIKKMCSVTGSLKSCQDMEAGSIFLKRLNNQKNIPSKTKIYTISAKGCNTEGKSGDGVVTVDSVQLEYAENFVINGTCTDLFKTNLHSKMLDTDLYPETYRIIRDILIDS